jgi:putative tryptophan/tyrosine transport system substrate-binding protein
MRRRDFIAGLGGSLAWPLVARAQQAAVPEIGVLLLLDSSPDQSDQSAGAAFRRGIGEQGYVEGRNVKILYRYNGEYQNGWPELAADLVRRRVAVIFTTATPAALAAKKATATIPIVFAVGSDPVQAGLVASLNRPGGNLTGTAYLLVELAAKRLELLHEIAPAVKSIGYLYRRAAPSLVLLCRQFDEVIDIVGFFENGAFLKNHVISIRYLLCDSVVLEEPTIEALETAARTLGLRLVTANASTPSEIERALAMLVGEGIGGLLISINFAYQSNQVVALAAHYALPTMYTGSRVVELGGLISYGARSGDAFRLAGTYFGRILKGENPADLPVQRSTRIEMVINLKTAKALGLTIPPSLLAVADEVIE